MEYVEADAVMLAAEDMLEQVAEYIWKEDADNAQWESDWEAIVEPIGNEKRAMCPRTGAQQGMLDDKVQSRVPK